MASVSIRGVYKSYGKVKVIHGLDLEISHNEFVVLIGPSGCGKSTMLRMIAGLEDITGGEMLRGQQPAKVTLTQLGPPAQLILECLEKNIKAHLAHG